MSDALKITSLLTADTDPRNFMSDNRPGPRYLIDPEASDAEWFEVRRSRENEGFGMRLRTFYTGGVNGKSAVDTAIGNVMDESEMHDEELSLWRGGALPIYSNGTELVARFHYGIGEKA